MKRSMTWVAAAAVLAASLVTANAATAAFPGLSGKIAFKRMINSADNYATFTASPATEHRWCS